MRKNGERSEAVNRRDERGWGGCDRSYASGLFVCVCFSLPPPLSVDVIVEKGYIQICETHLEKIML